MTKKSPTTETSAVRPPVVVVMGHVDHGKSTLLDFIRKTKVVEGEAGGITQHLGAYEVKAPKTGKIITFLDTPGHEAFSAIRERGATIADIAILVVSAEEGVKAQTLEARNAILAAGRPYIVAINKIDRPNANIERTKQNLAENEILIESYGGKIPSANISAKSGDGVDELLDLVLLVAEMENLTATAKAPGRGFILEANRDAKVGVTATLVIKDGTLKTGDFIVAGKNLTKIKKLEDSHGETIKEAFFSAPVKVFGFTEIPPVGDAFRAYTDKKEAEAAASDATTIATATDNAAVTEAAYYLPLIIKADVAGSLDALQKEVSKVAIADARFKIALAGLGPIGENDVKLAMGSKDTLIIGFNVKTEKSAADLAERLGITIETSNIIYKLSEWLMEKLEERRPKQTVEVVAGEAKILKFFSQSKDKQVVGGQVITGEIKRGREVKILRRGVEIGRGRINDLEQNKQKVGLVEEGKQFGSVVESKWTIAPGDVIQTFDLVSQ